MGTPNMSYYSISTAISTVELSDTYKWMNEKYNRYSGLLNAFNCVRISSKLRK